ncbi:MAG: hypothetical protein J7L47_01875 [Candidatus Odinarchaeota archaeon]|nr:hypothetical protein [Candidatus Odinarchaeota archaeon]
MNLDNTRILADFWLHSEVAQLYGVFREKDGFSERANIITNINIINENQKVIFVKVYEISQLPDLTEIFEVLKKE